MLNFRVAIRKLPSMFIVLIYYKILHQVLHFVPILSFQILGRVL